MCIFYLGFRGISIGCFDDLLLDAMAEYFPISIFNMTRMTCAKLCFTKVGLRSIDWLVNKFSFKLFRITWRTFNTDFIVKLTKTCPNMPTLVRNSPDAVVYAFVPVSPENSSIPAAFD